MILSSSTRVSFGPSSLSKLMSSRGVSLFRTSLSIHLEAENLTNRASVDLPRAPERGLVRHHVKSVASYGITRFPLSVTIQLDAASFSATLRNEQREKKQRVDFSLSDRDLGSLKIDYSGLDPLGMYPASLVADDDVEQTLRDRAQKEKLGLKFFKELEKRLDKEPVDSMLLSAVAGVAYV